MPSQPPESRNQIPWNCQVLSGCRLQSETQVMVNTVCQLDWAAGCPHSWLNLISGNVSKSVYALELVSWVKQAGVPTEAQRESVGGGLNYLFLPGGRAETLVLCCPWAGLATPALPVGTRAFVLGLEAGCPSRQTADGGSAQPSRSVSQVLIVSFM